MATAKLHEPDGKPADELRHERGDADCPKRATCPRDTPGDDEDCDGDAAPGHVRNRPFLKGRVDPFDEAERQRKGEVSRKDRDARRDIRRVDAAHVALRHPGVGDGGNRDANDGHRREHRHGRGDDPIDPLVITAGLGRRDRVHGSVADAKIGESAKPDERLEGQPESVRVIAERGEHQGNHRQLHRHRHDLRPRRAQGGEENTEVPLVRPSRRAGAVGNSAALVPGVQTPPDPS